MVKLRGKAQNILKALRAGNLEAHTIYERFGDGAQPELTKLTKLKYIEKTTAGEYRITELGKSQCPCRKPTTISPWAMLANHVAQQNRGMTT